MVLEQFEHFRFKMPFRCPGGNVKKSLELYLKSKGIWARSINLGSISIRCVLQLRDWIRLSVCKRGEDRRRIQHIRAESGKDGVLEAKGWSDCVVLLRSHIRRRLMLDDWIWQHKGPVPLGSSW